MDTTRKVTIDLDTFICHREEQSSGSNPYLWPAMVFVNKSTARVDLVSIFETSAHTILKSGMKTGESVSIADRVGSMTRFVQDAPENLVLILTVGVFEDNDTPEDAIRAGFRAFRTTLEASIESHLLALGSSDPSDVELARTEIAEEVTAAVKSATEGALSAGEKIKVALGILTPDSSMGSGSTSFENISSRPISLTVGDPMGGRLLRYVDGSQTGGGDVSSPQVIGRGGWQQFLHLFPGDGDVIYAVDGDGRLLRYVDASQSGGGDVSSPQVIGQGGWQSFLHLFPGSGNVIYAVDHDGRLLRYVDASQTGGGDVSSPQVVGQGGWQQFKFLLPGDGEVIYAVDQQGRLLRYVDASQAGGGDVSSPQVIGQGGWGQFLHLFRGDGNVIYAVDQQGKLLRYVDGSQTGGGDVSSPQVIGQGGWQQFGFLFSGGGNVIYAAERALNPAHNYEITGALDVRTELCFDRKLARNQAKVALDSAEEELDKLKTRFAQAGSTAEREEIRGEMEEARARIEALQAQLEAAEAALASCLDGFDRLPDVVIRDVLVTR